MGMRSDSRLVVLRVRVWVVGVLLAVVAAMGVGSLAAAEQVVSVADSASVTLYAVWNANSLTVTYDSQLSQHILRMVSQ